MSDSKSDESLPFDMCMISDNTPLVRDPDLIAAPMDGDLVMMCIESGNYYGVGGVGPRIWELLEQPVTVEAITAVICNQFDVDADRCRPDIAAFVRQLLDAGLVRTATS